MSGIELALDRGAHICHFYETFADQKAAILPFFKEGLKNGEHCLLVINKDSIEDWYLEFQAYGIDVMAELDRGALRVMPSEEYREPGRFNSIAQARKLLELIADLTPRFKAVRLAGDADWDVEPPLPSDELCHWEATADLAFEGEEVRTICQYNFKHYSPSVIHAALRTHPSILVKRRLCRNPYYEAPRILENEPRLNSSAASPRAVENMLARLTSHD
jgi:hypothetical protein